MRIRMAAGVGAGIVALSSVAMVAASPRQAVEDSERNATAPTAWSYWLGLSKAGIDQRVREAGDRVVNVQVRSVRPLRFNAVTVRNTGPHARKGGWSYGSEASVKTRLRVERGRLIDIDPFTINGRRLFAYAWVRNQGAAAKSWYWNYDRTVEQVAAEIRRFRIRLIDLDSYVVGGQRRYSYVGIVNRGVDAKAWWWYVNVTPQFAQRKADEHQARIVDIERPGAGLVSVVMQRNTDRSYSRHVYDYGLEDLLRLQASNGMRFTDIEEYRSKGQTRYAATLIDNATAENRRIRSLWRQSTMANAPDGNDAWFGIYAKEVGGPVHVNLAETMPYNPLSVLKLLPHLYVMDRLDRDRGLDLLDEPNEVEWVSPKGKPGEIYCPHRDQGTDTQSNAETLRDTLTASLGKSDNRAHEALLNKYGIASINAWAHAVGLKATNVFPGCPQPSGRNDWTANTSTLVDFGRLFEGVDTKMFFPRNWSTVSAEFYDLIADWDLSGIKDVVAEEAAKAGKSTIVNNFMAKVTLKGKGGGTIDGQADGTFHGGRGFFWRLGLPFVTGPGGATTQRTFVGGYFVDNFSAPCNEDTAKKSKDRICVSWKSRQDAAYRLLGGELFRTAIRDAVTTWP